MHLYETIRCSGEIRTGWPVDTAHGAPAVSLGEAGRGRTLTRLPLEGPAPPATCTGNVTTRTFPHWGTPRWQARCSGCDTRRYTGPEDPEGPLYGVGEGATEAEALAELRHGPPKDPTPRVLGGALARHGHLWRVAPGPAEGEACAVLVRDQSGYRGTWTLTGDPTPTGCPLAGEYSETSHLCASCGVEVSPWTRHADYTYGPAPRVLAQGMCAQGDAGRMGGGAEVVVVLRPGGGFVVRRAGRLYGREARVYYRWDGTTLVRVPAEEWPAPAQAEEVLS